MKAKKADLNGEPMPHESFAKVGHGVSYYLLSAARSYDGGRTRMDRGNIIHVIKKRLKFFRNPIRDLLLTIVVVSGSPSYSQ